MLVSTLEAALFAVIALCLLVPLLRGTIRRVRPASASTSSMQCAGEMRRLWAGRIGGTLFLIAIMNFLAYSVHTRSLGGSADNSKRVEGQYFVSAHGRYTEVTEDQWRAVRAHQFAMYITHAVGLLVGGSLLAYSERRRRQAEATTSSTQN